MSGNRNNSNNTNNHNNTHPTSTADGSRAAADGNRGYIGSFFTGGRTITITFVDEDACKRFSRELSVLYHENAEIEQAVRRDGMSVEGEEVRRRIENWLTLCSDFATKWGKQVLPDDLKSSWNSFEECLGRQLTQFPNTT